MPRIRDIMATMDYGPSPEAEGPVRAWLAAHEAGFGHFIGGRFTMPDPAACVAVDDPARDAPLARVARGSAADIEAAVAAARQALPAWSALPGHHRARHLYALARHVQAREAFLAALETLDTGKPIGESRGLDLPLVARHFYHHAGWAELVEEECPGTVPAGVSAAVLPWTVPLLTLAWTVAPALAAGNTVVLKPAELTPLTALAFAEICRDAGLPDGVVNIVTGDGASEAALVAHPGVDRIAFTGSIEAGRFIRTATAGSGKALTLRLGCNAPLIVFADADLDGAVEGVVDAAWSNAGQACGAGARLLLQESIALRFLTKLKRRMATLRVGDPLDKSTDIGAIVSPGQLERLRALVARGAAEGATLYQAPGPLPGRGRFFPPTLVTDVAPGSSLAEMDVAGPVAAAMTFRTPDEAAALADNTRHGLAASIWSDDIGVALDMAARVTAGVVWVNATNLFDAAAPFGGMKESGFGRAGGLIGLCEERVPAGARVRAEAARAAWTRPAAPAPNASPAAHASPPAIDRTAKLYIGGRQVRPDGGQSTTLSDAEGRPLGRVGLGGRKDIRNAVEAAGGAKTWSRASAHARAQVLYYVAENLSARAAEFAARLVALTGMAGEAAARDVEAATARIFYYAAWADKYDGRVQATRARHMTLSTNEPFGVMGLVCPENAPLLGIVSLLMPALAMGNRVVVVPALAHSLVATDFYQVLDTSDVPAGAVNIVTGASEALALALAEHHAVDALWFFGAGRREAIERASASNLKATWDGGGAARDWFSAAEGQGRDFMRHATRVKTVWIPYGA